MNLGSLSPAPLFLGQNICPGPRLKNWGNQFRWSGSSMGRGENEDGRKKRVRVVRVEEGDFFSPSLVTHTQRPLLHGWIYRRGRLVSGLTNVGRCRSCLREADAAGLPPGDPFRATGTEGKASKNTHPERRQRIPERQQATQHSAATRQKRTGFDRNGVSPGWMDGWMDGRSFSARFSLCCGTFSAEFEDCSPELNFPGAKEIRKRASAAAFIPVPIGFLRIGCPGR